MSNVAEVVFAGSAQQLLAEYEKLKKAGEQQVVGLQKIGATSKQVHQIEKQQLADAKRAYEETRTPLEKYADRVDRLRVLLGKGKIDQDTFNRGLQRQREILQAATPQIQSATAKAAEFVKEFLGIGTAAAGITAAAQALKAEYDALVNRQRQVLATQQTFGQAFRETLINFAADDTVSEDELFGKIQGIAQRTRTDPTIATQAATQALSARGALSNQQALDSVESALKLQPNNLPAAQQMSSRALDLLKSAPQGTSLDSVFGFLLQLQQGTEIANLAQLGDTAVPAILSTATRGDSFEQGGELFATLNNLMADQEGRNTRTAQIALSEQLAQSLPNLGSTAERIAFMQANPQARAEFLEKSSFEKIAQAPVEQLLAGANVARMQQAQAAGSIMPVDAAAGVRFQERVASLDQREFQNVIAAGEIGNTAVRNFQLSGDRDARTAQVRNMLFDGENAAAKQLDLPGLDAPKIQALTLLFEALARVPGISPEAAGQATTQGLGLANRGVSLNPMDPAGSMVRTGIGLLSNNSGRVETLLQDIATGISRLAGAPQSPAVGLGRSN